MKNYCTVAFSLIAASLFADGGTDASQTPKVSLFGESEDGMTQSLRSNDDSMPRASLFGENEMEKKPPRMPPPFAVFIGHPPYVFELEYSNLILQPTGSYLHYAAEANPLPALSPTWKIHDIHPDYHYGFDLGVKGDLPSTNTNVALDWEHFHSNDSASTTVASTHMIGPFFEIGPDAAAYIKAKGHAHFGFDQLNLDYGIFVHFGHRLRTNFFAGVGAAYIKENLKSEFSNPSGDIERKIETESRFAGAGPRFGVNFSYRIVKGFQFNGGFAADFFMGNLKNHTEYSAIAPTLTALGAPTPNEQQTDVSKRNQLVPGFEGNLNLAYSLIYRKHCLFRITAGYMAQIYLNAIQSADIGSEVVTPPVAPDITGVYARTFQRALSNFGLSGPFVKVTLAW